MNHITTRPGVVSLEIHGFFFLAADREARKTCPYIRPISETGAFVWKLLCEGKSVEEIISLTEEEFDVPESADLKRDIFNFINHLKEQNYIIEEKG